MKEKRFLVSQQVALKTYALELTLLILENIVQTTSQPKSPDHCANVTAHSTPCIFTAHTHALFLHLRACLETFHGQLRGPSRFTGPSRLSNGSSKKTAVKTFTLFSPPSDNKLTTVYQNSDWSVLPAEMWQHLIHIVRFLVFSSPMLSQLQPCKDDRAHINR